MNKGERALLRIARALERLGGGCDEDEFVAGALVRLRADPNVILEITGIEDKGSYYTGKEPNSGEEWFVIYPEDVQLVQAVPMPTVEDGDNA